LHLPKVPCFLDTVYNIEFLIKVFLIKKIANKLTIETNTDIKVNAKINFVFGGSLANVSISIL